MANTNTPGNQTGQSTTPGNQGFNKPGTTGQPTTGTDAKGAQKPGMDAGREGASGARQPGSSYDSPGADTRRKGDDVSNTPEETAGDDSSADTDVPATPGRADASDTKSKGATGANNSGKSGSATNTLSGGGSSSGQR